MSGALRLFVIFYAVATAVVATGQVHYMIQNGNFDWTTVWWKVGTPACYALLALGFVISREGDKAPGKIWLEIFFVLAFATTLSFLLLRVPDREDFQGHRVLFIVLVVVILLVINSYLLFAGMFIRQLGSVGSQKFNSARRIILPLFLVFGAALVLSSLFLRTSFAEPGWQVITWRKHWVTDYASVGQSAFLGPTIGWLQPIFGPVGYAFYLLGIVTSLAITVLLVKSRFSLGKIHGSALFAPLTASINLVSLWVLTDIYWGWHYDLSSIPWLAALAFACWLAALAFGAVLLWPVAQRSIAPGRLRALLIFQVPLLAFNLTMMPIYLGRDENFPGAGLALLIVGLQIEGWSCIDLLVAGHAPEAQDKIKLHGAANFG